MHHAAVAGTEFRRLEIRILLEIERDDEAEELIGAIGGYGVAGTHRHDLVGSPALQPSVNFGGAGFALASPSGAPALAHAAMSAI